MGLASSAQATRARRFEQMAPASAAIPVRARVVGGSPKDWIRRAHRRMAAWPVARLGGRPTFRALARVRWTPQRKTNPPGLERTPQWLSKRKRATLADLDVSGMASPMATVTTEAWTAP